MPIAFKRIKVTDCEDLDRPTFGMIVRWSTAVIALVASGVLVASFAVFLTFYGQNHWLPSWRWTGCVAHSVILFFTVLTEFRTKWRKTKFWNCFVGWVVAHFAVYAWVLNASPEWRVIWFLPITVIEFLAITYCLDRIVGFGASRSSRTGTARHSYRR
jgi:hypothetical protein